MNNLNTFCLIKLKNLNTNNKKYNNNQRFNLFKLQDQLAREKLNELKSINIFNQINNETNFLIQEIRKLKQEQHHLCKIKSNFKKSEEKLRKTNESNEIYTEALQRCCIFAKASVLKITAQKDEEKYKKLDFRKLSIKNEPISIFQVAIF